jgi:hypothetical protein
MAKKKKKAKKEEPQTRFDQLVEKIHDLHVHIAENRIEAVLSERWQKLDEAAAAKAGDVGERFDRLRKAQTHADGAASSRRLVAKFEELSRKLEAALGRCGPTGGAPE